jgi:hypothetical protein
MSILNAVMAGELFLKAIIAKEHPLLIFKDLFQLDDPTSSDLSITHIIEKGKTYKLEHLPKLLWVATGERLPDMESFDKIRKARNAIQHFCSPGDDANLRRLSLDFLYKNIDPLINRVFGLYAIEYHEDNSVGYDYVVSCLVSNELLFSVPDDFSVGEINLAQELSMCSTTYQKQLANRFADKGLDMANFGSK